MLYTSVVLMPQFAPIVFMLFFGTCLGLAVLALVILYGLLRRKFLVAMIAAALAVAGAGLYTALLLGASFLSRSLVLAPGTLKYFCEVDCHLAYSVVGVTTAQAIGAGPQQMNSAGTFYIVKIRTWFDPYTISPHRGNGPLAPSPRALAVFDDQGRQYEPSTAAMAALERAQGTGTPLVTPLRPGESYTTDFVFDLPASARTPRLTRGSAARAGRHHDGRPGRARGSARESSGFRGCRAF